MTTPPTDDLRARHVEVLRDLHDYSAIDAWKPAINAAIAALSAPAKVGGEEPAGQVLEVYHVDDGSHFVRAEFLSPVKVGDLLYTRPAADAAKGLSKEEYLAAAERDWQAMQETDGSAAYACYHQRKPMQDAAVGAQGDGRKHLHNGGRTFRSKRTGRAVSLHYARTHPDAVEPFTALAAGKGVDDAMVEILRATTKQIGDALKEHRDNDPFVMVNPVSLIGWSGALSKVAAALTRQPVAGDGK